jgi:plasmid stabilization system protein ParE
MKVRFTAHAKQDLIAIQDYIARDDEAAAYRVAQRIRTQVGRLAQHPQLGRPGHIEARASSRSPERRTSSSTGSSGAVLTC